jgi:hypothetical protein
LLLAIAMRRQLALLWSTVSLFGCASVDFEEPTEQAITCGELDNRSLIENTPEVAAKFGLERVLEQIRTSTPSDDGAREIRVPSARTMFEQLYYSYGMCEGHGADPARYGLACRPEATLATLDPFTNTHDGLHFEAVALVNRFDLAGASASSCGEARIVYWMTSGPVMGKAGFIVELAVPPVVINGRRTCKPIVDLWARLSMEPDTDKRITALESFYFHGLPGMAYPPVSAFAAGWNGTGQIRGNNFIDFAQWNLREVKWQPVCDDHLQCEARFVLVDTKNSPSQLLFSGAHPMASSFQTWFVDVAVPKLAAATTVGELSLGAPSDYDAYESISQPRAEDPSSVKYADAASPAMHDCITHKLAELGSPLTSTNILDRATATTCAGCHRVSRGADLGGGLAFPMFGGFTHVGEAGLLSTIMAEEFLPNRLKAFEKLACDPAKFVSHKADAVVDVESISGKPMAEPN